LHRQRPPPDKPQLQTAAEAKLAYARPTSARARTADELLHELRVHQIELEMQNKTLRQTQLALEESRDRYVELYEFPRSATSPSTIPV
jgi:phage-related minor tail protein